MENRFNRRPRPWLDLATANSSEEPGTSAERDLNAVVEPYVGMEFDSEDAAMEFYDDYARHAGFIMRMDQCRRSEVDKRILSRRFSCNKQGRGRYVKPSDQTQRVRKPRISTRAECKAMMLVKVNKLGKWVVTGVVKDHTHPLVSSGESMDAQDMKIAQLTLELEREDQLCEAYRGLLRTLLNNVEEQAELISSKVRGVVNNVREFETEVKGLPQDQAEDQQNQPEDPQNQPEEPQIKKEDSTNVLHESILTD